MKRLAAEPLPTGTLNCCFEFQSVLSRLLSVFTNSTILFLFTTYSSIFFCFDFMLFVMLSCCLNLDVAETIVTIISRDFINMLHDNVG